MTWMGIKITYLVACDACGRESGDWSDTSSDAIDIAFGEGYVATIVPNGSMWYFCPKCYKLYKEGILK